MMKRIVILLVTLAIAINLSGCAASFTEKEELNKSSANEKTEADSEAWLKQLRYEPQMKFCTSIIEHGADLYYLSDAGINLYHHSTKMERTLVENLNVKGLFQYNSLIYFFTKDMIGLISADGNVSKVWDLTAVASQEEYDYFDEIYDFFIYQDELYVLDSAISALKIDSETNLAEEFIRDFSSLALIDDRCYYVDHAQRTRGLYEMNLATKEIKQVRDDMQCDAVVAVNEKLFFTTIDPEILYQYDPSGKDRELSKTVAYYPFVNFKTDECFYYVTAAEGETNELYEYNASNQQNKLIATFDKRCSGMLMTKSLILYREIQDAAFKAIPIKKAPSQETVL